ncbi:MAG: hypothetical protein AAB726_01330 [Patescibacteria group bacterium]
MDETLKTLKENFEVLPSDVQDTIINPLTKDKIISIGTKYNLTTDQKYSLENETFFVLFGLEPLSKFRANAVEKVGVSYDQAIKISSDTNKEIFDPVMGLLKEMEEELRAISESRPVKSRPDDLSEKMLASNHLLPSHEMIREPHLHSQTLMPKEGGNKMPIKTAFSTPSLSKSVAPVTPSVAVAPVMTPAPASFKPTTSVPVPQPLAPKFSSIVDQKLSKLVRTERDESQVKTEVDEKRKNTYNGGDPYREPIK